MLGQPLVAYRQGQRSWIYSAHGAQDGTLSNHDCPRWSGNKGCTSAELCIKLPKFGSSHKQLQWRYHSKQFR